MLDGCANLPQHFLAGLADRRTQSCDHGGGIEIKDTQEILMLEIGFRLQSAAGHQRINDTDGGGASEGYSDVEIIIFLQKGTVNDVENVALVL